MLRVVPQGGDGVAVVVAHDQALVVDACGKLLGGGPAVPVAIGNRSTAPL